MVVGRWSLKVTCFVEGFVVVNVVVGGFVVVNVVVGGVVVVDVVVAMWIVVRRSRNVWRVPLVMWKLSLWSL